MMRNWFRAWVNDGMPLYRLRGLIVDTLEIIAWRIRMWPG